MPNRFRNQTLLFGVGGALCLGAILTAAWQASGVYHQRAAETHYRADHYVDDAEAKIKDTCRGLAFQATVECIREQIEAGREAERAEDDLQAQRDMADWAFWMLIASTVGVAVTAVGVAYVAATLIEARKTTAAAIKTASESERATSAALASVGVTREIGDKQLRAYLSYDTMGIDAMLSDDDRTAFVAFFFRPYFKNYGQTPAYSTMVKSRKEVLLRHTDVPREIKEPSGDHPAKFVGTTLGPGASQGGNPQRFSVEDLVSFQRSGRLPVVSARVDYIDAFGEKRHCHACTALSLHRPLPTHGRSSGTGRSHRAWCR